MTGSEFYEWDGIGQGGTSLPHHLVYPTHGRYEELRFFTPTRDDPAMQKTLYTTPMLPGRQLRSIGEVDPNLKDMFWLMAILGGVYFLTRR
jgi:hypothetical protein